MEFPPHGEANVYWLGKCLIVEVAGAINKEGAESFNKAIERQLDFAPPVGWTRVERILDINCLCTPDCFACLESSIAKCLMMGCIACRIEGGNGLIKNIFSEVCSKNGLSFNYQKQ